ncbi:hypothetical protein [Micromonospora eburnea]|uniref:Uncharacterized protein n=1 Tax=Micromonospora eburnea TaxID=227316 RepID=A0A1C6TTT6_9ACTN|nr:hypothetical protein [Micromonospora eburnea]SCL45089.1 hypothetical protein GA0070604_0778 [Micromonospora eburnea]
MSPFLAVVLVLVLGSSSYAAGRLHGQLSYRIGYRFGYRQGYFDGDRGAWNRRRRDAQAVIASALTRPASATRATVPVASTVAPVAVAARPVSGPPGRTTATAQLGGLATRQGTTYTGSSFSASPGTAGGRQTGTLVRRQG